MANNVFLNEHLVIGGCGINANPQEESKAEEVKDISTNEPIPADADLSEECVGTLADNADDFVFPDDLGKDKAPTETTTTDAETGEVTTTKVEEEKPTIELAKEGEQGFECLSLFVDSIIDNVDAEMKKRAETNEKLAEGMKAKTIEDCMQYIYETLKPIAKGMRGQRGQSSDAVALNFSAESTYRVAEYFFLNAHAQVKKKAESKDKSKSSADNGKKIVPLDPKPKTEKQIKAEKAEAERAKHPQLSLFD